MLLILIQLPQEFLKIGIPVSDKYRMAHSFRMIKILAAKVTQYLDCFQIKILTTSSSN